jgi:hypothetical protein
MLTFALTNAACTMMAACIVRGVIRDALDEDTVAGSKPGLRLVFVAFVPLACTALAVASYATLLVLSAIVVRAATRSREYEAMVFGPSSPITLARFGCMWRYTAYSVVFALAMACAYCVTWSLEKTDWRLDLDVMLGCWLFSSAIMSAGTFYT